MSKITVIKRNGSSAELQIDKWQSQIAKVCQGIADVSQSMIEIKSQPHFYDKITTKEIDEITFLCILKTPNSFRDSSRFIYSPFPSFIKRSCTKCVEISPFLNSGLSINLR